MRRLYSILALGFLWLIFESTAHKSEIEFAFKILAGPGFSKSEPLPQDERAMETIRQELRAAGEDPDEAVTR